MSVAGRKLTIRMPDNRRLRGAEVVGIHIDPGGRVREGHPVMTIAAADGEHRMRAPRPGRVVPLVSVGDEVLGGDPLFILNLDEGALTTAKSRTKRTMLRRGVEAFATAKREGVASDRPAFDRDQSFDDESSGWTWLKPGLAFVVYAIGCFALLPVFHQMAATASAFDLVAIVAIAVAFAALIAVFLMPSEGRWQRMTVRLVSFSWLVLAAGVLAPRMIWPPSPDATAGAGADAVAGLTAGPDGTPVEVRPEQAPRDPPAVTRSGVYVGQTDLIPMPRTMHPGGLARPVGLVAAPAVTIRELQRAAAGRTSGAPLAVPARDGLPAVPGAVALIAHAGRAGQLAPPPGLPLDLPDPSAPALTRLASAERPARPATAGASTLEHPAADEAIAAPGPDRVPSGGAGMAGAAGPVLPGPVAALPAAVPEIRQPAFGPAATTDTGAAGADRPPSAISDAMADVRRDASPPEFAGRFSEPVIDGLHRTIPGLVAAPAAMSEPAVAIAGPDIAVDDRSALAVVAGPPPVAPAGGAGPAPVPPAVAILHGRDGRSVSTPDPAWRGDARPAGLPGHLRGVAGLAPGDAADPVAYGERRLALGVWLDDQLDRLGTSDVGAPAAGRTDVHVAVQATSPGRPAVATDVAPVPSILPALAPVRLARAGEVPAVPGMTDEVPTTLAISSAPGRGAAIGPLPDAGLPDPVMIAALRAGDTAWMLAQTRRAGGERPLAQALMDGSDGPVATGDGTRPGADDRIGRMAAASGEARRARADRIPRGAPVSALAGELHVNDALGVPHDGGTGGPLPMLAAISPAIGASDAPNSVPDVPAVGPQPATRMVVYLFFDDPRMTARPGLGDAWAADLPPDVARGIWSNRVVAVHEIIQVEQWCEAKGPQTRQAWLNDRIRLLQVRIDMDPAVLAAFERALPLFDGAPPGFFHNRRPLLGGDVESDLIRRARDYLRETQGNTFFDSARSLSSAMNRAGCTGAIWNGGSGPVNALGTQLAREFGS